MILDLIKYIIKNILHRFTRSFLTILSILIGIMAIFTLISFGQGVSKYVNDVGMQAGADKLIAMPKGAGAPGTTGTYMTADDLDFIKKFNGVSEASGAIMQQAEVKVDLKKKGKWVFIAGMSTDTNEQRLIDETLGGIKVNVGRNLKKGDLNKIVLGYNYQIPNKIFTKPLKVGDNLYINDKPLEVIGFYAAVGNPQDDSNIYMTTENIKGLFNIGDQYGAIYIRAQEGTNPTKLASNLEEKLRKKKGQKKGQEDFYVQTFEQLLETFGTILTVLNSILVLIALLSVIVAAVNIMNTMYTAVLERTREIGIMKAIGARNSYILFVFFFESGVLGLIGGVLGIILGYGLAKLGGAIAAGAGYAMLRPYFPWWLIVGCLVFSFLVGAGSGFFPARQASKLSPVDALRYE